MKATLKPGVKATLLGKGKGVHLPAADLPLAFPVTAQLVTSTGGICWQGVYAAGSRSTSTATTFKGRAD